MNNYSLFGLHVSSELTLRSLNRIKNTSEPDVIIQLAPVSESGLPNPRVQGKICHIDENKLWLNIPNVASYLVKDGKTITIDPKTRLDSSNINLFLLGSSFGALMQQRGLFLLHGATIAFQNHCVAICGRSGIGKSTLAAAFNQNGYDVLGDDICCIHPENHVASSPFQIHLLRDSIEKIGLCKEKLNTENFKTNKFCFNHRLKQKNKKKNLKTIYIIEETNKENLSIKEIKGVNKFNTVFKNIYRPEFIHGLNLKRKYFELCTKTIASVKVYLIQRPKNKYLFKEIMETIIIKENCDELRKHNNH